MSFPMYDRYKESGVVWLGEVPDHWEIKKISHTTYLKGRVGWKGLTSDEYLDAGYALLVTGTDFRHKFIDWSECHWVDQARYEDDPYIQLRDGDLLITKDGTIGKLALVRDLDHPACLNSGIFLIRPLGGYLSHFMYWVLHSDSFRVFCDLSSLGSTIQHLYQNEFERFTFTAPPLREQQVISSFLEEETEKIDALIREQQRLIALLKEKRQATISQAVTKGLNPTAPMKDSCVAWIGEIPAHWRVGKCRRHVKIIPGFAFPSADFSYDANDTRLLRGINVSVGGLRWDETVFWKRSSNDGFDGFEVNIGDIVLGMDRPLISEGIRVAKVAVKDLPCLLLQRVALLRTDSQLDVDFLMHLLSSPMFVAHFAPETSGVSVPHISPEQIGSFVIPLPHIEEQTAIVRFLEKETMKCDALLSESQQVINLLQERRSALISAAVTGKIDVRNYSPREIAAHEEVYEPA